MAQVDIPKLVLFGDPQKGQVGEAIDEFTDFIQSDAQVMEICNIDECSERVLEAVDFAAVFGGDGSIISAARYLSKSRVPVIGVNLGKLGFLAEFSLDELKAYFKQIISGKAPIEQRMLLGCTISKGAKKKFHSTAVNEVFIAAGEPFKMIELKIAVDGQPLAGCVSDGLIISTPTGSTAYNLSAGGPILSGNMEAMVITPMCPHTLSFRPIVINADSKVEVFGIRVNDGTKVSVDGQVSLQLSTDDVVRIEKEGSSFLIVSNPIRSYWETLATKLSWAEKPKYKNP